VIELKEEVEQSIVTNEASVVPKEEKKMTKQQQIEIDQIKEMFDIGALTKEEYDTAIKRVLN
jgi:3-phosphoglycerate kinase